MSRQRIATASSVMIMVSVMAWSLPPVKSQSISPSASQTTLTSGKTRVVAYSKITPPAGGVRLLQDIFKRVNNAPQIAMAKPGVKKMQEREIMANQVTDQNLMIRPKGQGKNYNTAAPQLTLLAEKKETSPMAQALTGATNGTLGPYGVPVPQEEKVAFGGGLPQVNMGRHVKSPGDSMYNVQTANNRKGLVPPPHVTSAPASPATNESRSRFNYAPNAYGGGSAMGDADSSHADKYKARGVIMAPKPMSQPTPPPLKVAIGKLADTYKDTLQKMDEGDRLEQQAETRLNKTSSQRRQQQQNNYLANAGAVRRAKSSVDFLSASADSPAASAGQGYSQTGVFYAPSASPSAQPQSGIRKYIQQNTGKWDATGSPGIWESRDAAGGAAGAPSSAEPTDPYDAFQSTFGADKKQTADRELIALLPPNVVTGIPLIRLGSSEAQASSALAQIGKMKVEQVNNWNVWTWNKPGDKNPALQLYVRHGLLDAMRIFDRSLIGSDFGVTLGDDLSKVKETFGEPAFMVQEPYPGAGQNYIYPISQVGFQLARPAPNKPPRVVSVLIFRVK